jgi:hypothetical protein
MDCVAGAQAVFEAGTPPSASVAQWLKWAQVDLDQRINTPPNLQWLPKSATEASDHPNSIQGPLGHAAGLWPYPRVTGETPRRSDPETEP